MKCTCVTDIEKRLVGREFKKEQIVTKARMINGALIMIKKDGVFQFDLITNSDFEVEVEGMKRKQTQTVNHNFCPFCGVKISDDETKEPQ